MKAKETPATVAAIEAAPFEYPPVPGGGSWKWDCPENDVAAGKWVSTSPVPTPAEEPAPPAAETPATDKE